MPTPRDPEHMRRMLQNSVEAKRKQRELGIVRPRTPKGALKAARGVLLEEALTHMREELLTPALDSLREDLNQTENPTLRADARRTIMQYVLGKPRQSIDVNRQEEITFNWDDPAVQGAARLKAVGDADGASGTTS
jgi:hypothetical protein